MILPVQYRPHGDKSECAKLRGQASRVMVVLESMMAVGGDDTGKISFTPYDGSLIVARKFFGQRIVDIYAGGQIPEPPNPTPLICICNCNLSLGWILEVQTDTVNGAPLYTVMACNSDGRSYIQYRDILASDWSKYVEGQPVLMVPYQSMAYLCCTDKTGGASLVRGCSPLVSAEEIESSDWRTTYRILPWCAVAAPNRLDPSRWNTNA